MYFPFLRGKQNELLALRELLDQGKLSEKIVPIIEPVKKSATFRILLEQFDIAGRQIAVVQNSTLSNYMGFDSEEISRIKKTSNFIPAYFLPANESRRREPNQKSMEIITSDSSFSDFDSLKDSHDYVVVHEDNRRAIRSLKNLDGISPIELDQGLHKKKRNVDYAEEPDEFFSEEHKFYTEEKYAGFSDYSIIGEEYVEAGFAAKAVAIHLVYFDEENNLRIHHFVSDSNDDIFNPGNKFSEALEKMMKWITSESFDDGKNSSAALNEFKRIAKAGSYPGLGAVKKLSIEHHLEIMGKFLDGKIK